MRSLLSTIAAASLVAGCSQDLPKPPVTPDEAEVGPHGRLLLHPVANPERLLGHAVSRGADGAMQIAEELAPGCDVRVVREPAAYSFRREVDLREATSFGGGYLGVASIEAKYGRGAEARIEAKNVEVVRAELAGPCGEQVVHEVLVGTGKRYLLRDEAMSAELGGATFGGNAQAARSTGARVLDEVAWDAPQAYAYRTREMSGASSFDLEVAIPSTLVEGSRVRVDVTTSAPAYLVVYYAGADGKGAQILPSNEDPAPRTSGDGAPLAIPTPAMEKAGISFQAALLEPGKPVRERFVVVALAEKGDFELLRGVLEDAGGDAEKLEPALDARLARIPGGRWKKRVARYEIVPNN